MAYDKKLVSKAKKLFDRGFLAPQIFDELRGKISLRTLHRWVAEWKGEDNPEREHIAKETASVLQKSQELEIKAKKIEDKNSIDPFDEILNHLPDLTASIITESQDIKNKIKQKLLNELEHSETNTRAITALSQALTRHTEIIITATGMRNYVDINSSMAKVIQMGYLVSDPRVASEDNKPTL